MTWSTLRNRAQALGFDVAYQTTASDGGGYQPEISQPPAGRDWQCVGTYERVAGLWVRPLTEAARRMECRRVATLLEDCDRFVEPMSDCEGELLAACAAQRVVIDHPEWARMPA